MSPAHPGPRNEPGSSFSVLRARIAVIRHALHSMLDAVRVWASPWLSPRYGLDLRSVALFRMGLGACLLTDLFWRSLDLRAFYTDEGIMPRERLLGAWGSPLNYTFHVWGGDVTSQALLFSVAAVFGTMVLVGYRARLAAFMSWLFLSSLHGRNYLVLQGGDDMLRVMLFWAMFLPLGSRWAFDSVLGPYAAERTTPLSERPVAPRRVFSLATIVIVLQLCAVYVVTAYLKSGPAWHSQGSAIHLTLHHHTFVTRFGRLFAQLPTSWLQGLTWSIWWLEMLGPFLYFVPWRTAYFRTLQVFCFWGFHFGLFMCMELGPFPWVAIVAWSFMLPSWFWDGPVAQLVRAVALRRFLVRVGRGVATSIDRCHGWLTIPWSTGLGIGRPAMFVLAMLASYTAYGTVFAALHRGGVQGKIFEPLMMIRLYANWGMFAPNPPNTSGWFVTVARQVNGHEVDVWNDGAPVSWVQPELPSRTYKRERWRKFSDNILSSGHAVVRPYFLGWLCTEWNEEHDDGSAIAQIDLYHMVQVAKFPEKGYNPLQKVHLQHHKCKHAEAPAPNARR